MTYVIDFRFVPCEKLCHVISKQGDGSDRGRQVQQVCNRKETTW